MVFKSFMTSFTFLTNFKSLVLVIHSQLIEGKKYYLLNLPEEQRAAEAISRILRYGPSDGGETAAELDTDTDTDTDTAEVEDTAPEEVVIDDTTDIDIET